MLQQEFKGQDETSDSVAGQQEEEASLKVFQTHFPYVTILILTKQSKCIQYKSNINKPIDSKDG